MDSERVRKQNVEGHVCEALEKAKEAQARLNATVTFVDPKEQLKELEAISADAAMCGMPVVLKDSVNMKGIRIMASSRVLDNYIPAYNAYIIDKLQATGAVVIAKASMGELSMGGTNRSAYVGSVNSAWDESRISGRSSSNSVALVATGVVPFVIGTDTGDSMRKPAAYQGIIGMKPTHGRISRYGIISYAFSLDHVGYFTTSVQDTAVALEVLTGHDDHDMTSSNRAMEAYAANLDYDLRGKRITTLDNVQEAVTDPAIRKNFDTLMRKLGTRGAAVIYVRMGDKLMKTLMPTYYITANAGVIANRSNLDGVRLSTCEAGENVGDIIINTRAKGFCSYIRKRFVIGSHSLSMENQDKIFCKAQKVHRPIVEELNRVLANSDAVIASAAGTITLLAEGPKDSHLGADSSMAGNHMVLGNFSEYPSMTIPAGFAEGMPIGINMITRAFDKQTLFSIGLAIEEETGLKGNDVEVDT